MRLVRVFPRRTRATPTDDLVRLGPPTMFDEADEVHISVAFTWDKPTAEKLAKAWSKVAPTKVGGPAYGDPGGQFTPGKYLAHGYTITSRGCPNKCWFCHVWKRDPNLRELDVKPGWNVLDDNILACSDEHLSRVFAMLKAQGRRPVFTGGLEAARLLPWHCNALRALRADQLFFAYDTPDDLGPLVYAGRLLANAGFTEHHLRCYVLVGYPGDTIKQAERRCVQAWEAGFMPFAMLWRDPNVETKPEWKRMQREYARPAITRSVLRRACGGGA